MVIWTEMCCKELRGKPADRESHLLQIFWTMTATQKEKYQNFAQDTDLEVPVDFGAEPVF